MHPSTHPNASTADSTLVKNFSLNAGSAFGEAALIDNTKRSCTCLAETDVEMIVVPKDACVQAHLIVVVTLPIYFRHSGFCHVFSFCIS
jgi:CRP-like cAMP-binding protein